MLTTNIHHIKELKIEVNRNCPLQCLHCSSSGAPGAAEELTPARVCELIREFAYMGGERICISGGEPLCYEQLPRIIDACLRSGIETRLYTTGISSDNGSLHTISDKMLAQLSETGSRIIFSLHGATAETHDALTQVEGSFAATMAALARAIDAGVDREVHVVPTAMNYGELADLTALLASMSVSKISWLRFVPQGRGALHRNVLQLNRDQLRQLARTRIRLQQMYRAVQIRTGAPFNILFPRSAARCEAGLSVLTIRADGRAAPCDAFKRLQMSDDPDDVYSSSLSEIWERSLLLNELRYMHETERVSQCASCPRYSQCHSGCIAQRAIAAGRLTHGRDPECLLDGAEMLCGKVEASSVC